MMILLRSLIISVVAGVLLLGNSAYSAESPQKQCETKGGFLAGDVQGRGRTWGCVMPMKDAGKSCTDGKQCEAGFCVAAAATCDNKHTENPSDTGYEKCKLEGQCWGKDFPPKGCRIFLENGKDRSLCLD
jgi:hypothetical protein